MKTRNSSGRILRSALRRKTAVLIVISSALSLVAQPSASAQESGTESPRMKGILSLNLRTFHPQGAFEKMNKSTGFGAALDAGKSLAPLPIIVGGEASYEWYRFDSYTIHLDGSSSSPTVSGSMSLGSLLAFARFQHLEGAFRPYFEAVAGFTLFFTFTSESALADYSSFIGTIDKVSMSFNVGGGGGVAVRVAGGSTHEDGSTDPELFADARVRYLVGSSAPHYRGEPLYQDPKTGLIEFDPAKRYSSRSDFITISLGVMLVF